MSDKAIADQTVLPEDLKGPVVLVNTFTAKPGQLEAFIQAQKNEYMRLKGSVPGWLGNRLLRALDGKNAVNVATFASLDDYKRWRASEEFSKHGEIIKPYIEQAAPGLYEVVYEGSPAE
jgi:heme-degrading monooxygenase HmoA